jgi:hypothetical protein
VARLRPHFCPPTAEVARRTHNGKASFIDVINIEGMTPTPVPCLVSIICEDHVALADFYAKACGYTEIEAVHSPIFTALQTPGVAIGFHAREALGLLEIDDAAGSGHVHLNLDVGGRDEVVATGEAFVGLGATLLKSPFETYYGAFQTVVADPEGNVIRITTTQEALSPLTGDSRA